MPQQRHRNVAASRASALVLETGETPPDDPQYGILFPIHPVDDLGEFDEGETLEVGDLRVTPLITPGHTEGGTI